LECLDLVVADVQPAHAHTHADADADADADAQCNDEMMLRMMGNRAGEFT